jgi:two-component system sensor histidine kinase TctE
LLIRKDKGPGVQAADLPNLLNHTWRASELLGGCGLGLTIVDQIAQRHGSSVQAQAALPQRLLVMVVPLG